MRRKVLVRAPNWLGDVVVSTLFLTRYKRHCPNDELTVYCHPRYAGIYKSHPALKDVLTLGGGSSKSAREVAQYLRTFHFQKVYILPRSFRTALEMWLAKIPTRVGFKGEGRGWMLTGRCRYNSQLRYPDRYLALLDGADSWEDEKPFFPEEEPSTEEKRKILGLSLSALNKPILGVAPASIAPARMWPPERFAMVANQILAGRKGCVILFGRPEERGIADIVKARLHCEVVDTTGKIDLATEAPFLGWLMAQCDLFLGNDSGLMHVASAFGVPAVIAFGASDPQTALPTPQRFRAVQHRDIRCVPCLRNHCVRFGPYTNECLNALSIEEMAAEAKILLESTHPL